MRISDQRDNKTTSTSIEVHQVGKRYRLGSETRWVLRSVNLSVQRGECVFLVGPSGSGKSTLLSIIGCLLTPDEGDVQIHGESILGLDAAKQSEVRRQQIGFVFQRFQLIRGLTAEENVAIPLTLQGISTTVAIERAGSVLKRVGLADYRKSLPTKMSPGQCQRIAIARAIVSQPNLVLADEPTASLDGKSGREAMQLFRELVKESGATAIVVTHDNRIFEFADRICRIDNGILSEESNIQQVAPSQPVPTTVPFPLLDSSLLPSLESGERI